MYIVFSKVEFRHLSAESLAGEAGMKAMSDYSFETYSSQRCCNDSGVSL
jgi:hypothetical protein